VKKLLVMRVQACFNILQTFPVRKGTGKAEELIITRKRSDPVITFVFFNEFVKLIPWQMLQYLCEDRFPAFISNPPSIVGKKVQVRMHNANSNR
jgi:hypothetical protein